MGDKVLPLGAINAATATATRWRHLEDRRHDLSSLGHRRPGIKADMSGWQPCRDQAAGTDGRPVNRLPREGPRPPWPDCRYLPSVASGDHLSAIIVREGLTWASCDTAAITWTNTRRPPASAGVCMRTAACGVGVMICATAGDAISAATRNRGNFSHNCAFAGSSPYGEDAPPDRGFREAQQE